MTLLRGRNDFFAEGLKRLHGGLFDSFKFAVLSDEKKLP